MPRQRARVDANQPAMVEAFRRMGCKVFPTHQVGRGFPDLVVCITDRTIILVEIKDGEKPPSKRRLTPDEEAFAAKWPVHIVERGEDVERLVNGIRRGKIAA